MNVKEGPRRIGIELEDQAGSDPRWLRIKRPREPAGRPARGEYYNGKPEKPKKK